MKHVFATYFRILRRNSNGSLLAPVLQGLSRFAHLINVEFFDDLIASMQQLVDQKVGVIVQKYGNMNQLL
jgi:nucleolar complex protein 3